MLKVYLGGRKGVSVCGTMGIPRPFILNVYFISNLLAHIYIFFESLINCYFVVKLETIFITMSYTFGSTLFLCHI